MALLRWDWFDSGEALLMARFRRLKVRSVGEAIANCFELLNVEQMRWVFLPPCLTAFQGLRLATCWYCF